jgi:hypothetical protein
MEWWSVGWFSLDSERSGISNGYSRQICETRELLPPIWRGESHFFQKWYLGNVGESGESSENILANVGESGESLENGLASVGESRESSEKVWQILASLVSLPFFQKRPFWQM